jgi:hypothetical protein
MIGAMVSTAEEYKKLQDMEQQYFVDMVKKVKDSGANLVLCQVIFLNRSSHIFFTVGFRRRSQSSLISKSLTFCQMGRRC